MIEAIELTKHYGPAIAVDKLSFTVQPGIVTGFLGPNGSGKSTTMRMILGLDRPTSGTVTVAGRPYQDAPAPMHEVGAVLDARAIQGGRTARQHLTWLARAGGFSNKDVDAALEAVGLRQVANRKVGGFSLGMSQRLGIATALLGNPRVLLFDEPVNGLDPEGIRWIRTFLRNLASEGRTILVSSHLMSEMEETAEHVIVIGRGRLIADASIVELTNSSAASFVHVLSPHASQLLPLLQQAGAIVEASPDVAGDSGSLTIRGLEAAHIGQLAADNRIVLHELAPRRASLEAAFMELTYDSVEYHTPGATVDAAVIAETARAIAGADAPVSDATRSTSTTDQESRS